nr:LOG family protein [uncultured Pseudodesulfovibrio sp.]
MWNQPGYHAKPCGLLDEKGFFTCLAEHMDRMVDEGFVIPEHRKMVLSASVPATLLD